VAMGLTRSDGLLLAASLGSTSRRKRVASLSAVVGESDSLNAGAPSYEQVSYGLDRLWAAGLLDILLGIRRNPSQPRSKRFFVVRLRIDRRLRSNG
jgi:hypothetical protein